MIVYLLFGACLLSRILSDVMRKKNSSVFSVNGLTGSLFYVFETSLFALFYFWALNGFRLEFNSRVVIYGLIYGAIVVVTLIPSVFVYNYASFAFISLVSGSASLVLSLLSGMLLFGETISFDKVIRVVMMFVATAVVFVGRNRTGDQGKEEKAAKGKDLKRLIIVLSLIMFIAVIGAGGTAVLKYYSADTGVTDQNSFFFITNVFSAVLVIPLLPFTMKRDNVKVGDIWRMVKSKKTVYSAITTLNSNVYSIIQIILLGMMDVSVFTPIASAFSFVAVAVATPIIGERLDRYTVIATVLAVLSVVIPSLIV